MTRLEAILKRLSKIVIDGDGSLRIMGISIHTWNHGLYVHIFGGKNNGDRVNGNLRKFENKLEHMYDIESIRRFQLDIQKNRIEWV